MSVRLRLMTYNIHKGIGVDRRYQLERVAEVIDHYQADVVALQEVDQGVPRSRCDDQCQRLAALLGYPYVGLGLNVKLRRGWYGNATLSRFPLADTRNLDLTWGPKKARGALLTPIELDGPGRSLLLCNVHLGLSYLERRFQMRRLLEALHLRGTNGPELIVGDTNDWLDRLFSRVLRPAGFECATPVRGCSSPRPSSDQGRAARYYAKLAYGRSHLTFPSWFPLGALDKVFLRGGCRPERAMSSRLALARVASDHLPVIADLVCW